MDIEFPHVHVQLSGTDSNAYSIIARVTKALRSAGHRDQADDFARDAMNRDSYDALLQLTMRTVHVS
jgi:hypothetical protein